MQDNAFKTVEIPIIQRDYAQGRKSVTEIRTQFLDALHGTLVLPSDSQALPLDLDFVYGNVEEERKAFCPLDGQQRLTTLFLLHWYVALKEDRTDDFRSLVGQGTQSRFTYRVRPSSQEFFDAVVHEKIDFSLLKSPREGEAPLLPSHVIGDAPWFFLSWHLDPTIQSALEMIDSIHAKFCTTDLFYDRLTQSDPPYITFQFLNLKEFGLSDDLYIKMNARGKPLTVFEAFKARLEQLIDRTMPTEKKSFEGHQVSLREYFSRKVDSTWADLFWTYRDEKTHLFDQQFMNFFRATALVHYPHDKQTMAESEVNRVLGTLGNLDTGYTYFTYEKDNCLTAPFLRTVITLLDSLSNGHTGVRTYLRDAKYYDEKAMFERVLGGKPRDVVYSEWVQFYAYCAYLCRHGKPNMDAFYEWMRVISNLATNTIYNRVDEFREALLTVKAVLDSLADQSITKYLATAATPMRGFNGQQVREERLKAHLMLNNDAWLPLILKAEQHGYFRGQIEFLLNFSGALDAWSDAESACAWTDTEDQTYRDRFSAYYEKADAVFDATGLRPFAQFLWERALLATGDYLLPAGPNWSFLSDRKRETSWKRLLRGGDRTDATLDAKRRIVQRLFDQIAPLVIQQSLQEVIDRFLASGYDPANEWRRQIVGCPAAIVYCGQRAMRRNGALSFYLLSKIRMNGRHAELFTFHLKDRVLGPRITAKELLPFDSSHYWEVTTDSEEPFVSLHWEARSVQLTIAFSVDQYRVTLVIQKGPVPTAMATFATALGFQQSPSGSLIRYVPTDQILYALEDIAAGLKTVFQ